MLAGAEHPEILDLLRLIIREMEQSRPHYHHVVRELFGALFLLLLRPFSGATRSGQDVSSPLGWSPLDGVQMVRIDRACVLLYNCEYSVTEIGMQVGYPSPSSFNRQFRRIHGISPSQWRQRMRSEDNPMVTAYFNSLPPSTFQFFPVEYQAFQK